MTTAPLVSVIVPAFNRERTIGATLSGILGQTYPNVEAVVVDDGSSDRTVDIARAYDPERVRVFTRPNGGPGVARNTALQHARGEFVATCDSDDILLPNHVETAMATLHGATVPRPVVSCTAYVVSDQGLDPRRTTLQLRPPALADQRLTTLQVNWATYMLLAPRAFFDDAGGYPDMRSSEDWELLLHGLFAGWNIVKQTTPTALYWESSDSLTRDRGTMTRTEDEVLARIHDTYGARMTPRELRYLERRLAEGSPMAMTNEADRALRAGDRDRGADLLRRAHELNPREPRLAAKARAGRVPVIGPRLLEWYAKRT